MGCTVTENMQYPYVLHIDYDGLWYSAYNAIQPTSIESL